jgi:hypothetical protein
VTTLLGPTPRIRAAIVLPTLVLALVAAIASWASAPYLVGVFRDDGMYVLLAKAIATGQGFHYVGLPGAPAATHYPPLYPLLLAAVWRFAPSFPDNLPVLLGLNALLLGMAALGLYSFATTRLGWRSDVAAIAAALATITPPVLLLSSTVLSEPFFLAALWPALIAAERAVMGSDRRHVLMAGVSIGLLMLLRTHAVALLAALVLVLLLRHRRLDAVLAAGFAVLLVLPWQLWTTYATPKVAAPLEGAYGSYLGWFVTGLREGGAPFLLATVRANLAEFWLLLGDRVAFGPSPWLVRGAQGLFACLIVLGAWGMARRAPVCVCFVAAFLGIILVWPYAPWRFVGAVWPLVLLLAAEGVRRLVERSRTTPQRALVALAVAIPCVAMAGNEWTAYRSRSWLAPARDAGSQIAPVVTWVSAHTQSGDVVMTEGPQVVTLFTGRRSTPAMQFTAREYLVAPDSAAGRTALRAMLEAVPARYVVTFHPLTQHAARSLATGRPALRELGTLPRAQAVVFEVVR